MRKIPFLILFILINSRLFSQNYDSLISNRYKPSNQIGFKIGYVQNTLEGTQVDFKLNSNANLEGRKGVEIGFNAKIWFNKFLYTRIELNYIQKGGSMRGGGFIYADEANINYLNLPAFIGISFIPNPSNIILSLEPGISYNLNVGSNENLREGLHPDNDIDEKEVIPSFNIGANLEFYINSNSSVFINYRYYKDLTYFFKRTYHWKTYDNATNSYLPNSKVYDLWHEGSSITVGMFFKIKS